MKQFFKYMFATILGMAAFFFVVFLFGIVIIASISVEGEQSVKVKDNSILHVKLRNQIEDRSSGNFLENFDLGTFEQAKTLGLNDILNNIKKAKTDSRIKGILLDLSSIQAGMATVEEIRNALNDFKESEKWIISYSEVYTQKTYYLASIADKIYLNPAGIMELRGLATELAFFKKMLEKLDIDVQIIRHGKFKSAVEPFMLDKMSDSNREQMQRILNTVWGSWLNRVSGSRNIKIDNITKLADGVEIRDAFDAKENDFVDDLFYKDQLLNDLRSRLEIGEKEDINSIGMSKYCNARPELEKEKGTSKNKIAVVYASGSIVSGESNEDEMGSETISKAIRKARNDEEVKAIVLRVNSPGGSALASDVIWREVTLAKQSKPVVVSMGDVAASGGYYISCAADKILASEKTITGSIGVFGLIPNMEGFFDNKIGITFDRVRTNEHSDMLTVSRPLSEDEKSIIQFGVEKIYDDFISKVAEGRKTTKENIDSIGQGRVWVGKDALENGLVDEIGGLREAIKVAEKMANVEDFEILNLPKQEDPIEKFLRDLSGDVRLRLLKSFLGKNYIHYERVESIKEKSGIMARLPFDISFH